LLTTSFPLNTTVDPLPIASNLNAELVAPVIFAAPKLFWTVRLIADVPTGWACTCVPLFT
jgi:hypothetical protein